MSRIVGATHPGNRDHNEDCFVADASIGLGLVADGMGGYACGEVASELVRITVVEAISNSEGLRDAIVRAHAVVRQEAVGDESKKGMGSTVIAFRMQGQDYELAWVGDSRAYLWDASIGTLHQITRDHSYVETLLSSGAISHDEAINHPNRNLITQAIGVPGGDGLEIELISGRLGGHQQLLICSDGLVDEVVDEEIADILAAATSLDNAVQALVQTAINNGGSDNVSVVLAACSQASEPAIDPEIVRSTVAGQSGPNPAGETSHLHSLTNPADAGLFSRLKALADTFAQSESAGRLRAAGINPSFAVGGVIVVLVVILLAILV